MAEMAKLPVTREDLYEFRFVSGPSLSPEADKAVYVITQPDQKENTYHSAVWVKDLADGRTYQAAAYGEAKAPLWLDNETILFQSGRDQEKKDAVRETRFYKLSLTGGEASLYMTVPLKVEGMKKLQDGLWVLSASADEREEEKKAAEEDELAAKEGVDFDIYEELPFWFNGKGIRSRKRAALFLYRESDQSLTRISPKFLDVTSYDVSACGRLVAFTGPVYDSVMPRNNALYLYDRESGETRQLTSDQERHIGDAVFMGSRIFYTGITFERVGKHPRFFAYDLQTDTVTEFPYCDSSIGNGVGSDAKFGSGKSLVYEAEQDLLYMIQTSWGDSHLMTMDHAGQIRRVSALPGAVLSFDVRGGKILLNAMRGDHLAELYLLDAATGKEEKLTGHNDAYLEQHAVQTPESFRYPGSNGFEMEAYVIYPKDYDPAKTYGAVFEIHGGPKGVDGSVFFHEFQCLASDGYFVFYGNPRGSDGRGEQYCDITEVFGKEDFADLMELTDQVLARYPMIDPKRVGICGGSYGGFMCNWMIGHTDRYAAAVSQRSISNYLTKCLYTDIGYYANRLQMGAFPWEDFDKVWEMSPLSGAAQAKTPTLWVQSDEDYRCWMGDAIQMYSAVKRQGTPGRMILFHGENHELSRSGKPENRMARLRELENWFASYLA